MFDYDDIVNDIVELDWKIQVNCDSGTRVVDHSVIAHSANKWNLVPVSEHTITYPVLGSIPNAFKVFSLCAHASI